VDFPPLVGVVASSKGHALPPLLRVWCAISADVLRCDVTLPVSLLVWNCHHYLSVRRAELQRSLPATRTHRKDVDGMLDTKVVVAG